MMELVGVAHVALSYSFDPLGEFFEKWTVVRFSDNEKIANWKGQQRVDPYIGVYENGELVLR